MGDEQNWRTDVNASDYFLHQQKRNQVADRRPVIRRPSDLVGPGIAQNATRITDFNDVLATFNGYYSAAPGADNAPYQGLQVIDEDIGWVGEVSSDGEYGGTQRFTNIQNGDEFRRTFQRASYDPNTIAFSRWFYYPVETPAGVNPRHLVRNTNVPSGVDTSLLVPGLVGTRVMGDRMAIGSSYASSGTIITLLYEGVYTGAIRVTSPDTFNAGIFLIMPDGGTVYDRGYPGPISPSGVIIPFTFINTSPGLSTFRVEVSQTTGSSHVVVWDELQIHRVGEAQTVQS